MSTFRALLTHAGYGKIPCVPWDSALLFGCCLSICTPLLDTRGLCWRALRHTSHSRSVRFCGFRFARRLHSLYLQTHPCTVRVRTEGERGVLTIKGQTRGFSREEFEYEIPRGDADRMLDTLALPSLIDKIRYKIPYQGFVWEVDEFLGDNAGLVVAEIELSDEGQAFERPGWIGEEVTGDRRYANSALASRPFCMW